MRLRTLISVLLILVIAGGGILFASRLLTGTSGRGYGSGLGQLILPLAIIALIAIAVVVIWYWVAFPEIKTTDETKKEVSTGSTPIPVAEEKAPQSVDVVLGVLQEDERKVVEALLAAGGTMLQRDIVRKVGYSKVKTHRILYRLSQRKIVTAKKHYNTNEITLVEWLVKKPKEQP